MTPGTLLSSLTLSITDAGVQLKLKVSGVKAVSDMHAFESHKREYNPTVCDANRMHIACWMEGLMIAGTGPELLWCRQC